MEERIRQRLEELRQLREQLVGQLNACNGAIGELEALLEPAPVLPEAEPGA